MRPLLFGGWGCLVTFLLWAYGFGTGSFQLPAIQCFHTTITQGFIVPTIKETASKPRGS